MCTAYGTYVSLACDTAVKLILGFKTEKQHTLNVSVI